MLETNLNGIIPLPNTHPVTSVTSSKQTSTVRVTFYLGQVGLPAWLIKGIHQQIRGFEGYSELIKVHTLQRVNVQQYLSALTFAFQPFDLCEITLCGKQAETYAATLRLYLQQDCFLLESPSSAQPQGSQNLHSSSFQFHHDIIQDQLEAFIRLYRLMTPSEDDSKAEKSYILQRIAKIASLENYKAIETQLAQREQVSSTGMQGGVALPHVITESVSQPKLICLTSHTPINWQSKHGLVTHVVALLLPKPCSNNAILAVRNLAVSLIDIEKNQFISAHHNPCELQAILTCLMMPK
ncbi:PTS sugar transporter subunit IIA [Vibrio algicola]|uniref:PTS sugar transporter subunit IIA n=1 Tax=Vibrio algicola TaxID=2662262 RepID=UPI001C4A6367|nr:PTS sugar transporter subunit IIA [Vibrio algicola]